MDVSQQYGNRVWKYNYCNHIVHELETYRYFDTMIVIQEEIVLLSYWK